MAETFQPVTPLFVNYECDRCETVMKPTGETYQVSPPLYPHVCPSCGFRASLKDVYPLVRWFEPGAAYKTIK